LTGVEKGCKLIQTLIRNARNPEEIQARGEWGPSEIVVFRDFWQSHACRQAINFALFTRGVKTFHPRSHLGAISNFEKCADH
jgi:hypothetical protein